MKHKTAAMLMATALIAFGLFGCSGAGRPTYVRQTPKGNLLFSPPWTGLPTFDVARSSWPSTVAFGQIEEVVDYRERIIDRQGWFGTQQDFYYRRFDGIRIGRARR